MQALDLTQGLGAAAAGAAGPANGAPPTPESGEAAGLFGALVEDALGRSGKSPATGSEPAAEETAQGGGDDPAADALDPAALALLLSVVAPAPVSVPAVVPPAEPGAASAQSPDIAVGAVLAPASFESLSEGGGPGTSAVSGAAVPVAAAAPFMATASPFPEGATTDASVGVPVVGAPVAGAGPGAELEQAPASASVPVPTGPAVDPGPGEPHPTPAAAVTTEISAPRAVRAPRGPVAATAQREPVDVAVPPVSGRDLAATPATPTAPATKPDGPAPAAASPDPVRALARELARMTSTPATPASETTGVATMAAPRLSGEAGADAGGGESGGDGRGAPAGPVVLAVDGIAGTATAAVAAPDAAPPARLSAAYDVLPPAAAPPAAHPAALPLSGSGDRAVAEIAGARMSQIEAILGSSDPDRQNVHAIVRTLRVVASADGASEARLRLQPEHLGQLALNIRVEQGSVSAHFHTDNPEAQRWIETHQQELRGALRQQGLEVKELVVSSTDPDRRQQGRQPEREQPRGRARREDDGASAWDSPRFEVVA